MTVSSPVELQKSFEEDKYIHYALANFGSIPYGRNMIGRIIRPEPTNLCTLTNETKKVVEEMLKGKKSTFFIMAERGNCTFT